jgi:hypothetical protein
MRYIPQSKFTIAEIEEQCRRAILKADEKQDKTYAEVLEFARWENDMLIAA